MGLQQSGRRPSSSSQVNLPLGGVARRRAGGRVFAGHAQRHLLQGAVLTGGVATAGVGTAGGRHAGPRLLPSPDSHHTTNATNADPYATTSYSSSTTSSSSHPGTAVSQPAQAAPLLVRHEGGELGRVALGGLADGRGLAGHPAGVRVAQLAALLRAVARHGHVRQGADVCQKTQEEEEEQEEKIPLLTNAK